MATQLERWEIFVRNYLYVRARIVGDDVTINFEQAGRELGKSIREAVELEANKAYDEGYDQGLVDGRAEGFDEAVDTIVVQTI
jgi:hypothetical protein